MGPSRSLPQPVHLPQPLADVVPTRENALTAFAHTRSRRSVTLGSTSRAKATARETKNSQVWPAQHAREHCRVHHIVRAHAE